MIGKTRSGLTLTDTLLVRLDEWYNNYSNYSDYKYTCNTDSATCTEATLRILFRILFFDSCHFLFKMIKLICDINYYVR